MSRRRGTAEPAGPAASPSSPKDKTEANGTPAGYEARALDAARHLAEHGVPIFVARPDQDSSNGFRLPPGWQRTQADPAVVDTWRRGDALCAVMGHVVDGVDFDLQKPGATTVAEAERRGLLPRAYGVASTPSGGRHYLVAPLGVTSRNDVLPAVDVKAGHDGHGHGFLFIAPTVKPSKVTGDPEPYQWEETPQLDMLELIGGDVSGAALREHMMQRSAAVEYDGPSYGGPAFADLTEAQQQWSTRYVTEVAERWRGQFAEALTWPEGQTDERGRGWEALARDWAWVCARMAVAPWTHLDAEAARALHDDVLPDELAADGKCSGKWSRGLLERAAERPVEPPPWEGLTELTELPQQAPSGGWSPVDLTKYLDGTYQPLEAQLLRRDDGVALLYPGMTHSLHGQSESGKSMIAQYEAVQQMRAGSAVLYVDYEADPGSVTERMLLMGATHAQIRALLTYVKPEVDPSRDAASRAAFESLLQCRFSLAVLDGVNEALTQMPPRERSTSGLGGNDDITAWQRRLPVRIAERTGAAVVMIDHVAKGENAGRFAIGGQAKMAALTGAAYVVRPASPIGKGLIGTVELWVAKDRHGYVRPHANPEYDSDRLQHVATATVNGVGGLTIELAAPPRRPSKDERACIMQGRVVDFLSKLPADHAGASLNMIKQEVTGNDGQIADAVKALAERGDVTIEYKGMAKLHRLSSKSE